MWTRQEMIEIMQLVVQIYNKDNNDELMRKTAMGEPVDELRMIAGKNIGAASFCLRLENELVKREDMQDGN